MARVTLVHQYLESDCSNGYFGSAFYDMTAYKLARFGSERLSCLLSLEAVAKFRDAQNVDGE